MLNNWVNFSFCACPENFRPKIFTFSSERHSDWTVLTIWNSSKKLNHTWHERKWPDSEEPPKHSWGDDVLLEQGILSATKPHWQRVLEPRTMTMAILSGFFLKRIQTGNKGIIPHSRFTRKLKLVCYEFTIATNYLKIWGMQHPRWSYSAKVLPTFLPGSHNPESAPGRVFGTQCWHKKRND